MIDLNAKLKIEKLGARGEGVAQSAHGVVFTPYALPGDEILAEVDGERGKLVEVLRPSQDRIPPFCAHYTICGGCAVQGLRAGAYDAWKRGLLEAALANAGVAADVRPLVDAHGLGRRRAVFHARYDARGRARVGFMQARAHDLVEIDACPLLAPALRPALAAARAIADALRALDKPLDIAAVATQAGLDVDIRGAGRLEFAERQALIALAQDSDLARISNHGVALIEVRQPFLVMGAARVAPPPGAFLQATAAGEEALTRLVCEAARGARRVADLFAGVGTFALRLAEHAEVDAVEMDGAALAALARAAHHAAGLKRIATQTRDLFRRPLSAAELQPFDCVVFDPPRAGAPEQARQIAASDVARVVGVSCNPQTFARDAKILIEGGFALESATPVDQFRASAHLECVGVFNRARKSKPRRSLLSR
ncbi:MAG: class I SAM-dependent RNA methyltransferase [Hyphomicrobiales bacterium]|nr:class I SAM-dependent RNA methyltransferase [Hyphomicrobiales bacterium]